MTLRQAIDEWLRHERPFIPREAFFVAVRKEKHTTWHLPEIRDPVPYVTFVELSSTRTSPRPDITRIFVVPSEHIIGKRKVCLSGESTTHILLPYQVEQT